MNSLFKKLKHIEQRLKLLKNLSFFFEKDKDRSRLFKFVKVSKMINFNNKY